MAAAIGPRTRAILCVHQMGMPCDLAAILADRAAPRLAGGRGCRLRDRQRDRAGAARGSAIGRPHGDVACFSFHPRKVITTGDGGMLTTRDADLDRQFRLLRQHGMSIPDTVRHGSPQVLSRAIERVGYNYRMTDMQAAIGRAQLERLPGADRGAARASPTRYRELLADLDRGRAAVRAGRARGRTGRATASACPIELEQRR